MLFQFWLNIPIWAIFLFTLLIIFLAFELGSFLGQRHRSFFAQEDRSAMSSIVAATLGLVAFLLAITFGYAANRFEDRRLLVLDEANAIGTTYLRAEYLDDPYRTQIKHLLSEYVVARLQAIRPGRLQEGIKKSEELQDQLWRQAIAIAEKNPNSIVVGLFIQSLNEVIDLHAKRVSIGTRIRIPFVIWGTLYFVTILAIGTVGYQFGLSDAHYRGIIILLILTFSIVIVLIADLDRPQEGFIKVSQQSLIDLSKKFNNEL